MTHNEAADAIMEVMQEFVNAERKKVWDKHQDWRQIAKKFIQFHIDSEAKSPPDALNQVYAKGPFAGASVRSVVAFAKQLLKPDNDEELDTWSKIQISFPLGHRDDCSYRTSAGKVIGCNCGLHDALSKIERYNDE